MSKLNSYIESNLPGGKDGRKHGCYNTNNAEQDNKGKTIRKNAQRCSWAEVYNVIWEIPV